MKRYYTLAALPLLALSLPAEAARCYDPMTRVNTCRTAPDTVTDAAAKAAALGRANDELGAAEADLAAKRDRLSGLYASKKASWASIKQGKQDVANAEANVAAKKTARDKAAHDYNNAKAAADAAGALAGVAAAKNAEAQQGVTNTAAAVAQAQAAYNANPSIGRAIALGLARAAHEAAKGYAQGTQTAENVTAAVKAAADAVEAAKAAEKNTAEQGVTDAENDLATETAELEADKAEKEAIKGQIPGAKDDVANAETEAEKEAAELEQVKKKTFRKKRGGKNFADRRARNGRGKGSSPGSR